MPLRLDRRFGTLLIAMSLAVTLGPAASATAVATPPAHVGSTPAFPAPASERAPPTAAGHAPATVTGRAATPFKATSTAPARTRAQSQPSSKLSTAAIVVAAIAALLALGCAAWGLARRRAFEPHWLLSLRHSMAEAGFRTSATWAEFADWARLGR
jgi:hypothetical protein